jgi:hypothetical protein
MAGPSHTFDLEQSYGRSPGAVDQMSMEVNCQAGAEETDPQRTRAQMPPDLGLGLFKDQ